jgi:hypothetical protein
VDDPVEPVAREERLDLGRVREIDDVERDAPRDEEPRDAVVPQATEEPLPAATVAPHDGVTPIGQGCGNVAPDESCRTRDEY